MKGGVRIRRPLYGMRPRRRLDRKLGFANIGLFVQIIFLFGPWHFSEISPGKKCWRYNLPIIEIEPIMVVTLSRRKKIYPAIIERFLGHTYRAQYLSVLPSEQNGFGGGGLNNAN